MFEIFRKSEKNPHKSQIISFLCLNTLILCISLRVKTQVLRLTYWALICALGCLPDLMSLVPHSFLEHGSLRPFP